MPSDNVIIGIHGLANKPPEDVLKNYWAKSIAEGLKKNAGVEAEFDFELVYWAKLLYSASMHENKDFDFDPLYNSQPYIEAGDGELKEYRAGFRDYVASAARGVVGLTVDGLKKHFGVNSLADWLIGRLAKDLAFYYSDREISDGAGGRGTTRNVLRENLQKSLEQVKGRRVMLVAHSMGTIVAFDTLNVLADSGIEISHFVTIGSPLGLPHVKGKILSEFGDAAVTTPQIVKDSWVNFADRRDPVAADTRLKDDYGPNSSGVRVVDDLVLNDYHIETDGEDKENAHKSYGYLRTPEFSKHLRSFLET